MRRTCLELTCCLIFGVLCMITEECLSKQHSGKHFNFTQFILIIIRAHFRSTFLHLLRNGREIILVRTRLLPVGIVTYAPVFDTINLESK